MHQNDDSMPVPRGGSGGSPMDRLICTLESPPLPLDSRLTACLSVPPNTRQVLCERLAGFFVSVALLQWGVMDGETLAYAVWFIINTAPDRNVLRGVIRAYSIAKCTRHRGNTLRDCYVRWEQHREHGECLPFQTFRDRG